MACRSEHAEAHGHSHGSHDDHRDHDHDAPDHERGFELSLFKHIDQERVRALNEKEPGSAKTVFKPWDARTDRTKV
jgi:ABC-type Zn2+ transport system substrate-binding protein/surface adhesin